MTTERRSQVDPQAVRSHVRGRGFRIALIAAWPASVAVGVIGSLIFGGGIAAGVAGGLALAVGISFVWVVFMLAVDDGNVDKRAREAVRRNGPSERPQARRSTIS